MITKLVVEEFEVTQEILDGPSNWNLGEMYSFFFDPETGKYYQPSKDFTVTATKGTDLADLFVEVK